MMPLKISYRTAGYRRRGGAFFTMCLFIMTLVSTGLMYYYFQRSKALQNELAELRTSGVVAGDGGAGRTGAVVAPEATADKDDGSDAADSMAGTNDAPVTQSGGQVPVAGFGAFDAAVTTQTVRDQATMQLDPINEQPQQGATAGAPDTLAVEADAEDLDDTDRVGRAVDGSNSGASGQRPVQSLYDTMTPAVRVRAPGQNR